MLTALPDPGTSRAILAGVSRYEHLDDLPAVENNLSGLVAAFTDPALWGLPADRCVLVGQPEDADAVLDALQIAAAADTETLIFYFAGHGLTDPDDDDELYLALPGSDKDRAYRRTIPYSLVRREMKSARARRKIVILDCCYSGRAIGHWMGPQDLADRLGIEGTCVLTATAPTRMALSPPGSRFTAFTGELIDVLATGIPHGPSLLDMNTIHQHLAGKLRAKGLPSPQMAGTGAGGDIALARNRSYVPPPVDGAGQPTEVRPSWLQGIDAGRELLPTDMPQPVFDLVLNLLLLTFSLAIWIVNSYFLAATEAPSWLLSAAAAAGSASLLGFALRGKRAIYLPLRLMCIPAFVGYAVVAFIGNGGWIARAWIVGSVLPYALAGFTAALVSDTVGRYSYNKEELARLSRAAGIIKGTKWLTSPDSEHPDLHLLEPLLDIPAARFAVLREGRYRFLIVAGKKVLLAAFADWQAGAGGRLILAADPAIAGELAGLTDEARSWRDIAWLPSGTVVQPVVVVRWHSAESGAGGPEFSDYQGIAFVTPEEFGEYVGSFLAPGAYQLNIRLVMRLLDRLKENGQQSVLSVDVAPSGIPPRIFSTGGAASQRGADTVRSDLTLTGADQTPMPWLTEFDAVAADSVRYAAALPGYGKPLNTRAVLLALARVHVRGRWDRIWLHCACSPDDIASQSATTDLADHPRTSWNGVEFTAACADAFRTAARLSHRHHLPITPGVLLLGLVADPDTAAAKALGVGVTIPHEDLIGLIESDLIGFRNLRPTE